MISATLPRRIDKKPPKWLYASLFIMLLTSSPFTVLSDDSFCTQSWLGVGFTDYIAVAIKGNSSLYSWGNNFYSQLGYPNTTAIQRTPGLVGSSGDAWQMVALNNYYTIAMKTDGSVYGWGWNTHGNLGVPSSSVSFQVTPLQISSLGSCKYIAVLGMTKSTFAIKTAGTLWAFGSNDHGQLGKPKTTLISTEVPQQIGSDANWASVWPSMQDSHVCALKTNGSLYCWGQNDLYQLGDNSIVDSFTPILILSPSDEWLSVHTVYSATIALHKNGTAFGFGTNVRSHLAQPSTTNQLRTPTPIATGLKFKKLSVSSNFVIGIADDGTLWGWGENNYLQVNSQASVGRQTTPNQISSDSSWSKVFTSVMFDVPEVGGSAFGIKNDGSLWGWGKNNFGQLGVGSTIAAIGTPTQVMPGRSWSTVSAGPVNTGAIDSIGELFIFGSNSFGQLGDGTILNANTPLSCINRSQICSQHICGALFNCDPSCFTCSGPSSTNCTGCTGSNFLHPIQQTCGPCPDGFYGDIATHTCKPCDGSCFKCSGPSPTNCTACNGSNFYISSNNTCGACPDGFYGDVATNTCKPCDTSCAKCTNGSPTGCTQCPSSTFLLESSHSCVNPCPDGFFGDTSTHKCLPCHGSCFKCNGASATNCTACIAPSFYISSNHSCGSCPNGFYGDAVTNTCKPCDGSCFTCTNGSPNGCSGCTGSTFLLPSSHSCVNPCPSGFFGDLVTHTCLPCDGSCFECSGASATNCTACNGSKFYISSNHTCGACPDGFYGDVATHICKPCDGSCAKCTNGSPNGCTQCPSTTFLLESNHSCVNPCPDGFFADSGTRKCLPCDGSCFKCSGASPTNCTACNGTNFYISSNNTCGACPDGFYGDSATHTCKPCDTSCAKCTNGTANGCTGCPAGKYLHLVDHSCVNPCPGGYISDTSTQTCVSNGCHPTCLTCNGIGANQCLNCDPNSNTPVQIGSGCFTQCTEGSWLRNLFICLHCDVSCSGIGCSFSSMNCLACASGYTRVNGLCIRQRMNRLRI